MNKGNRECVGYQHMLRRKRKQRKSGKNWGKSFKFLDRMAKRGLSGKGVLKSLLPGGSKGVHYETTRRKRVAPTPTQSEC